MNFAVGKVAAVLCATVFAILLFPSEASAQRCELAQNITSSNAKQIEGCVRSILNDSSVDPFLVFLARRDAACVEIQSTLYNYSVTEISTLSPQSDDDKFCGQVIVAQESVYGAKPFWSGCVGNERLAPDRLRQCILGAMRISAAMRLPSQVRYCSQALELHMVGASYSVLNDPPKSLGTEHCTKVMEVISELQDQEAHPCFMRDRLDIETVFARCMAGSINATDSCESLQSEFNKRYHDTNGGYPAEYHPDFSPPSCAFIDGLRPESTEIAQATDDVSSDNSVTELRREAESLKDVRERLSAEEKDTTQTVLTLIAIFVAMVIFQAIFGVRRRPADEQSPDNGATSSVRSFIGYFLRPAVTLLSIIFWCLIFVNLAGVTFGKFLFWYAVIILPIQVLAAFVFMQLGIKGFIAAIGMFLGWSLILSGFGIFNEWFLLGAGESSILNLWREIIVSIRTERYAAWEKIHLYYIGFVIGALVYYITAIMTTGASYFDKNKTHREGVFSALKFILGLIGIGGFSL